MGEDEDEPEIEVGDESEGTPINVAPLPIIVSVGQVGGVVGCWLYRELNGHGGCQQGQ